jgi:tyrosyl-tRNA synthetase
VPEAVVQPIEYSIANLVRDCFAMSGAEARRLVEQGGVTLDGEKLTVPTATLTPRDGQILKAGKRKFARLKVG